MVKCLRKTYKSTWHRIQKYMYTQVYTRNMNAHCRKDLYLFVPVFPSFMLHARWYGLLLLFCCCFKGGLEQPVVVYVLFSWLAVCHGWHKPTIQWTLLAKRFCFCLKFGLNPALGKVHIKVCEFVCCTVFFVVLVVGVVMTTIFIFIAVMDLFSCLQESWGRKNSLKTVQKHWKTNVLDWIQRQSETILVVLPVGCPQTWLGVRLPGVLYITVGWLWQYHCHDIVMVWADNTIVMTLSWCAVHHSGLTIPLSWHSHGVLYIIVSWLYRCHDTVMVCCTSLWADCTSQWADSTVVMTQSWCAVHHSGLTVPLSWLVCCTSQWADSTVVMTQSWCAVHHSTVVMTQSWCAVHHSGLTIMTQSWCAVHHCELTVPLSWHSHGVLYITSQWCAVWADSTIVMTQSWCAVHHCELTVPLSWHSHGVLYITVGWQYHGVLYMSWHSHGVLYITVGWQYRCHDTVMVCCTSQWADSTIVMTQSWCAVHHSGLTVTIVMTESWCAVHHSGLTVPLSWQSHGVLYITVVGWQNHCHDSVMVAVTGRSETGPKQSQHSLLCEVNVLVVLVSFEGFKPDPLISNYITHCTFFACSLL